MKLRNKKTGEIVNADFNAIISGRTNIIIIQNGAEQLEYNSLAELNEEWEDYKEPKEYWYIDPEGTIICEPDDEAPYDNYRKQIGNYFDTREEAEKAVEKLKIYNKLKQKGFVFSGWYYSTEGQLVILADNHEFSETEPEDLTELFGGEE